MVNEFWFMGGYNIYIWPCYFLTFLLLFCITFYSIYLSRKAKKMLKKLEELED